MLMLLKLFIIPQYFTSIFAGLANHFVSVKLIFVFGRSEPRSVPDLSLVEASSKLMLD